MTSEQITLVQDYAARATPPVPQKGQTQAGANLAWCHGMLQVLGLEGLYPLPPATDLLPYVPKAASVAAA